MSSLKVYLNLVRELTLTEFKLKYKGSFLGFIWSLLKPLFILGTLYMVFHVFMRFSAPHYELFLLLGIILWMFFQEATQTAVGVIVGNAVLVSKVAIPRWILVLSTCLNATLIAFLNILVFFAFTVVFGVPFSWGNLLFPYVIIAEFILVLGIAFGLSALYVRYRDVIHIWEVIVQAGFWVTPIIYSVDIVPSQFRVFYDLNPMARIITTAREILISNNTPSISHMILTLAVNSVILVVGYMIFRRLEPTFAEDI